MEVLLYPDHTFIFRAMQLCSKLATTPSVIRLLLPGAELPLVESFALLNDRFPFPSILDAGYPVFDLHLADVLCDVILPSVLGSSL
jgi:hypothetical protein